MSLRPQVAAAQASLGERAGSSAGLAGRSPQRAMEATQDNADTSDPVQGSVGTDHSIQEPNGFVAWAELSLNDATLLLETLPGPQAQALSGVLFLYVARNTFKLTQKHISCNTQVPTRRQPVQKILNGVLHWNWSGPGVRQRGGGSHDSSWHNSLEAFPALLLARSVLGWSRAAAQSVLRHEVRQEFQPFGRKAAGVDH